MWEAATVEQVANWRNEDQAAAELLATQQRERRAAIERDRVRRMQDPGAIKQWLVLSPVANQDRNGPRALREEQVAQESQLQPRAGHRATVGGKELIWQPVPLEDYLLDFTPLAGAVTEWHVAYAVSYIHSEASQGGVLLKVGSDDQSKIYLNGKLIYEMTNWRQYLADVDVVAGAELKAGINTLVFKVVNQTRDWQGSVWLTDKDGNPLPGIRVTLDPEVKDSP